MAELSDIVGTVAIMDTVSNHQEVVNVEVALNIGRLKQLCKEYWQCEKKHFVKQEMEKMNQG